MSRSVRNPDYTRPEPPKPVEYRIERCANMLVYVPVKEESCKPQS